MPSHDHWCVLCAPTGKIGAQTSAPTHFLAKKVSALGSSLPIGDMKGNTSRFSQRCCLQRALLTYRLPALDKVWRGRSGLSSVLARSRGWDQGQCRRSFRTSESRSCARCLTNVDKKLMSNDEWLRHLSLAASRPKLGPLPLEVTLRKANSLSSICRQRNELSPPLSLSVSLSVSVSVSLSLSISLSLSLSLSLCLCLSLSLSIYLSRSPSLPRSLPVSLSLSHTHTHTHTRFVPILRVSLSGTSVHLHGCAVTVFCSAFLLMPLDTTQTLVSTEEQRKKKRCLIIFAIYNVDRHN